VEGLLLVVGVLFLVGGYCLIDFAWGWNGGLFGAFIPRTWFGFGRLSA
jgi:hypothetical protein